MEMQQLHKAVPPTVLLAHWNFTPRRGLVEGVALTPLIKPGEIF